MMCPEADVLRLALDVPQYCYTHLDFHPRPLLPGMETATPVSIGSRLLSDRIFDELDIRAILGGKKTDFKKKSDCFHLLPQLCKLI